VWHANWQVYGVVKVWKQMHREGLPIARCTVQRLMRKLGLEGARRGKKVRTTRPDTTMPCPLDLVNRQFKAHRPDQLWVADFTYVSTWQGQMFVAFVIDVYARRILGWRVSSHMRTDFVVDPTAKNFTNQGQHQPLKCVYSADDSALECFPDLESEGAVLDQPFTASELNAKKKTTPKTTPSCRLWTSLVELG